jgi:hypothetical protein
MSQTNSRNVPTLWNPAAPAPTAPPPLIIGDANTMYAYARERTEATNNYILSLGQATAGLAPPTINPAFPTVGEAPAISVPGPPELNTVVWSLPGLPDNFTGTLNVDDLLPAPFDGEAPVLSFPLPPDSFSEVVPASPSVDTEFAYPTLNYTLPEPPQLLELVTYTFDGVTLPTIDPNVPELSIPEPAVIPYTPGSRYTSALLTAMKASLEARITAGGTGLAPSVEQAIWDRGREREARAAREAIQGLERMEAMGFSFPPGVYLDARLKVLTETEYANVGHSREVMIEAARLELDNVKHALTTATQLESTLIDYTYKVETLAFESAKYATQAYIEIYNAKVRAYAAYLDAYKTRVAIYEAQIRGELANVEVYKASIEAEQAKAQINTALVAQYKTSVDASLAGIEAYKAELSAIQTRAQIEKLKVEIFGEEVRAYAGKISAYTANVEAFRALVGAEGSKQEAYRSRVQAYAAEVEASTKAVDARIAEYRGQIEAKGLEWTGYKAAADAEAARAKSTADLNSATADVYRATVQGVSGYNDALTKQWQASIEQAQRVAEIGVAAAKANADLYMTTRSLALDAAKVGAQVSAQLGAAALNAINWSSSVSSGYNTSYGLGYNLAQSVSDSYQYSVSYNYNASV